MGVSALAAPPVQGTALDIVEGLTTEIGPRMPGTEAEARARDWAVKKLVSLGFKNVRIETFDMPVWVRGTETAEIVSPFPQKLIVTALGNSAATPEGGLTAQVVAFGSLAELEDASAESVKGKIVFITHRMRATQDGSSYGAFGPIRRNGPSLASRKGAAAIVIRSLGTDMTRFPHTGVQTWAEGVPPIPAGALSLVDAENLERMLVRDNAIVMKIVLTPRNLGVQQSGNVIGEIPGTDPAAGVVAIGGHLDSWDLGTGAFDDAAGLAITTAAAKGLMDTKKPPRRTVRVIWFGAEEVGIFGGNAYLAAHGKEPHALVAESDFGADRVWRVDFKLPDGAKPLADRIKRALAPLGIAASSEVAGGGPDLGPVARTGVSAIDLQQDGTRYFDLHHTPNDTFDKIDPLQLRQNVEAWSIMLDMVANASENLLVQKAK
ncbi:MAG: M20/M25/M40 family metallo-hydrolase [Pseudomonadota bacterium]